MELNRRKILGFGVAILATPMMSPLAALSNEIPPNLALPALAPVDAVDVILDVVTDHFQISLADIKSYRRTSRIHPPRLIAMHLACELSGQTRQEIGVKFNGRDSTVIEHCDRCMRDLTKKDPQKSRVVQILADRSIAAIRRSGAVQA